MANRIRLPGRSLERAWLSVSLLLLTLIAIAPACSGLRRADFQEVPGVQEITLRWQPRVGMRLVYQVSSSGHVSRERLAWNRESAKTTVTRIMEITAVESDYFDMAGTEGGVSVTFRFSTPDWSLRRIEVKEPTGPRVVSLENESDPEKVKAFRKFQDLFKQGSQFLGNWRVGQLRVVEIRLPTSATEEVTIPLSMILRRVVLINGRSAAQFDLSGSARIALGGTDFPLKYVGTSWADLVTGVVLRSATEATGDVLVEGQQRSFGVVEEQVLDFTASKLLTSLLFRLHIAGES